MSFAAKVVLDSIAPCKKRLITVEATYPRFIHSELLTHRALARNSASSRAIPWKKVRKRLPYESLAEYTANMAEGDVSSFDSKCMYYRIKNKPVVPLSFDAEQKGMQSGGSDDIDQELANSIWLDAMANAVESADRLARMGVHKSIVNRLTEPFMWITVVITATEWKNFFRLRCHPAAEKHFQKIAGMIRDAINESTPKMIDLYDWHCPYLTESEQLDRREAFLTGNHEWLNRFKRYSVARCARVSYLTHDGTINPESDLQLCSKLIAPPGEADEDVMHASPFEHVGWAACDENYQSGPFFGWGQYRKDFRNENSV